MSDASYVKTPGLYHTHVKEVSVVLMSDASERAFSLENAARAERADTSEIRQKASRYVRRFCQRLPSVAHSKQHRRAVSLERGLDGLQGGAA